MRISMFSVSTLEVAWNEEGERDAGDGGGGDDNGMGAEEMRGAGDRGGERARRDDHCPSAPRGAPRDTPLRGPGIHRRCGGYWVPGLAPLARDDSLCSLSLVRHGERGGFHLAHAPAPAVAEHRPGREP